jgi:hypothetical protein
MEQVSFASWQKARLTRHQVPPEPERGHQACLRNTSDPVSRPAAARGRAASKVRNTSILFFQPRTSTLVTQSGRLDFRSAKSDTDGRRLPASVSGEQEAIYQRSIQCLPLGVLWRNR